MLAVEKLFECTERISMAARKSSMRCACLASGELMRMGPKSCRGGKTEEVPLSYERRSCTARQWSLCEGAGRVSPSLRAMAKILDSAPCSHAKHDHHIGEEEEDGLPAGTNAESVSRRSGQGERTRRTQSRARGSPSPASSPFR